VVAPVFEEVPPMSSIEVRPFRRSDREQVTALVNAHAAAVVPGLSVSVNAVLAQFEREPGEFIVDPWVSERLTLVAEQRGRVVAAAHLLRYADDERVSDSFRDAGEIRWLLFWPEAPYWPDSQVAADGLIGACVAQLERWQVTRQYADGTLPPHSVYGVPDQWPHVRELYERAGFVHEGRTEIVFMASLDELAHSDPPAGVELRRSVGVNGTRLAGVLAEEVVGYIEVERFDDGTRLPRSGGFADVGNLHVAEPYRRRGVASWLLGEAAAWLELGGVDRLLDYAALDDEPCRAFLKAAGFRELTRTARGWRR
jgi:GNAT superfamily N-acetyltransferase